MTSVSDFKTFYNENYQIVFRVVCKLGVTNQLADDIIQETFIKAWNHLSAGKDLHAGWLCTVARNLALDHFRKKGSRKELSVDDEEQFITLYADDDWASFHWEQSVQVVEAFLQSYDKEPQGSIARSFYRDKISVKDIADEKSMKVNTVLSHLRRFRAIAQKALADVLSEEVPNM